MITTKSMHCGLYATNQESLQYFWQFEMPCGYKAVYAINEVPTVDTPCPCGNPRHWIVRIGGETGKVKAEVCE